MFCLKTLSLVHVLILWYSSRICFIIQVGQTALQWDGVLEHLVAFKPVASSVQTSYFGISQYKAQISSKGNSLDIR